jgi:hypothetical protein
MKEKITLRATHQGMLHIANMEIPAFVLEDGRRMISQRGLRKSIGMSGSGGNLGEQRTLNLVSKIGEKGLESTNLVAQISTPLYFKTPKGGLPVFGYEATILTDLCEFILQARDQDLLTSGQDRYAIASEALMRSLAKVGIVALVDEATGFQEVRDRLALQKILEKYLLEEYQKTWAKRFPNEFYEEMFRLKGWQWNNLSVARPGVVGTYTNDIVYKRLAPDVLKEIQKKNKQLQEEGQGKVHQHRWLTLDTGIPSLDRHIHAVVALMRASGNWRDFMRLVERSFPPPDTLFRPGDIEPN